MARFGERGFGSALPTHFQRAARLVRTGVLRGLAVPDGLDRLDTIAAIIETDVSRDRENLQLDALAP
jgi:hypothetical protein